MNHAIKLGRIFSQSSTPLPSITSRNSANSVRFIQASSNTDPKKPSSPKFDNMDKTSNKGPQDSKNLNVMEEAFGEGYSTRSDEEGFGGIYGGNDEEETEMKVVNDPAHHDNTQGSHVSEKEKGRNQTSAGGRP